MEITANGLRKRRWQGAWIGTVLFGVAFRLVLQPLPSLEPVYQYILSLPYAAFAALVFCDTSVRAQTGYRLLSLCFLWAVLTAFFHTYDFDAVTKLAAYFLMMLFGLGMCYPMAFVLPEPMARRAYSAIAATFVAGIAVFSSLGCYTAIWRVMIESPGRGQYEPMGVVFGRLSIFAYPTAAAVFCALALLLSAYLFWNSRRALVRCLIALASVVTFVALALTGGRIASVFLCVCLGGVAYLLAETKLQRSKGVVRVLLSVCAAAIIAGMCYALLQGAVKGVNLLSDAVKPKEVAVTVSALSAPAAPASAPESPAVRAEDAADADEPDAGHEPDAFADGEKFGTETQNRSIFDGLSTLQGRTYAWQGALDAMAADPLLLLFGSSPVLVMDRVDPFVPENTEAVGFFHLHSIYFQTLVSFGVIGFLLFAAAIGYILFHAARLFFLGRGCCTVAERSLPLLLVFSLGVDLLEVFLTFSDATKMSNPLFFLTAGYVVYLSTTRLPLRQRSAARAAGREG